MLMSAGERARQGRADCGSPLIAEITGLDSW